MLGKNILARINGSTYCLALKIQKFYAAPWALKIPFTLLNTYILKAINNAYKKNKTHFNKNQLPLWLTTEMDGTTAATFNTLYPGTLNKTKTDHTWEGQCVGSTSALRATRIFVLKVWACTTTFDCNIRNSLTASNIVTTGYRTSTYMQKFQDAQGQRRSYGDASDAAAPRGRIHRAAKRVAEWMFENETNWFHSHFNPLKPELNPICYSLALLGAHHFLHVSKIRVKLLTFRLLMLYIYGAPILDVSRSHTTTQHSR